MRKVKREETGRATEIERIRIGKALRIGAQQGTWIGRLDSKSKLKIIWKVIFGSSKGRAHEIACTVSHKSKKRQVFFDGELIHSGALGLLESVGGVAADTTLFEHTWQLATRKFVLSERVFVRENYDFGEGRNDDSSALREAARFELRIDDELFQALQDIEKIPPSILQSMEQKFQAQLRAPTFVVKKQLDSPKVKKDKSISPKKKKQPAKRPKSVPKNLLKIQNDLAVRFECTLGPGVLGGKIILRNDQSGQLVEIAQASNQARACGVDAGDILLSLNGRALPPKLDALELMSLLQANPRYMHSEVTASLWRPLLANDDEQGKYIACRLTNIQNIQIGRLDKETKSNIQFLGHFFFIQVPNQSPLQPYDLLVGIDGNPIPKYTSTKMLAQNLGDWVAENRFDLIAYRPTSQTLVNTIQTALKNPKRSIKLAPPAEIAAIAAKSHAGIWGTATIAVTVTGDGGHGEQEKEEDDDKEITTTNKDDDDDDDSLKSSDSEDTSSVQKTPIINKEYHPPKKDDQDLDLADDKNFAVFKRLLHSGATLDEIVAEMRTAGVPKEIIQRIFEKLRHIVAEKKQHTEKLEPPKDDSEDPRKAMLAMIAQRNNEQIPAAEEDTNTSKNVIKQNDKTFDALLARYRKMVKIGVPAASVHQRMRLDQIDQGAIEAFANEHGILNIEQNNEDTPNKKGAKLHWDAMHLDDKALAVSVWAADAFADHRDEPHKELLGDNDLERLTNLFLDENKQSFDNRESITEKKKNSLQINGRPLINTRLFESQRSQNVSITITPLSRQYNNSADALVCLIARMEQTLPLEQLETLRTAMPTNDEKKIVLEHVQHASTSIQARELIDKAIEKDPRFSYKNLGGIGSLQQESLQSNNINIVDKILRESYVTSDKIRDEASVLAISTEGQAKIRKAFIIENLAPAEKFAYAVANIEAELNKLRQNAHSKTNLSHRLEALVIALSSKPATEILAEKADNYTKAARLLMNSKDLARLLKHVLAAGNAVNAGSAKADASAVRLSSLLQAARTKGIDGKTTLLDGVVGLLLDRALNRKNDDDASPLSGHNEVLDFPENSGILASLDLVRGADEKALAIEANKIQNQIILLNKQIQFALAEFGPEQNQAIRIPASLTPYLFPHGSSKARRSIERDRLTQLETEASLRSDALKNDHIKPLQNVTNELRSYFACEPSEPLDAIFTTMRDFLRAFCDSRDIQRRQRRAEMRLADRHEQKKISHTKHHKKKRPPSHPPARPPSHPPPSFSHRYSPNSVQSALSSVKNRRSALVGDDDDEDDSNDITKSPPTSDGDDN